MNNNAQTIDAIGVLITANILNKSESKIRRMFLSFAREICELMYSNGTKMFILYFHIQYDNNIFLIVVDITFS